MIFLCMVAMWLFIYDIKYKKDRSKRYKNIRDSLMIILSIYSGVTTNLGVGKGILLLIIGMIIGIFIFLREFEITALEIFEKIQKR